LLTVLGLGQEIPPYFWLKAKNSGHISKLGETTVFGTQKVVFPIC
jgi:hypothetical protein